MIIKEPRQRPPVMVYICQAAIYNNPYLRFSLVVSTGESFNACMTKRKSESVNLPQ